MPTKIFDPELERELMAVREANGADRYDEVWEGVYVMSPMPNDEHQMIVSAFSSILQDLVGWKELGQVRPGVNVSDRVSDWKQNYRVPDVAVFLNETKAVNHDTFWLGGPDLAIEIISPGEEIGEKIDFYGRIGTVELLVIDRNPWSIRLFRLSGDKMELAVQSTVDETVVVNCQSVAMELVLQSGENRPRLIVSSSSENREWKI